jgi:hypothetical protein
VSGAGAQPAGTSPGGIGAPEEGNPQDGVVFQAPDGTSNGSRYIDQGTRDYVMNANGRLNGMPNIPHLVQFAILTEKNSAAVRSIGQELRKLDRITPNFEKRVLGVLTEALQPLIDARLVELVGFASFKTSSTDKGVSPGRIYGRLLWRDLTTRGEPQELFI